MLAAVSARAAHELVIILFELGGRIHLQVCQPPVAPDVVQVLLAVLQKDSDRFVGCAADQRGIDVSAPV